MSGGYSLKISPEQAKEMPMVDLAYEILKVANTPLPYRDLMQEIAKIKGFSEEETLRLIAQLYTEINIDGRFACVGNNTWGLKRWYPVDRSEEVGGAYPHIINDDDEEEDDYYAEEETYDREDEYESLDEESEFLPGDEEESFFPGDDLEEPLDELADSGMEEEVETLEETLDDLGVPELDADLEEETLDAAEEQEESEKDDAEPAAEEETSRKRPRGRK